MLGAVLWLENSRELHRPGPNALRTGSKRRHVCSEDAIARQIFIAYNRRYASPLHTAYNFTAVLALLR